MAGTKLVKKTTVTATTGWFTWEGGRTAVAAFGTFGGTTAKLQVSWDDGTTAIDVESGGAAVEFTAAGGQIVDLPNNADFRWLLTGGAGISLTLVLDSVS